MNWVSVDRDSLLGLSISQISSFTGTSFSSRDGQSFDDGGVLLERFDLVWSRKENQSVKSKRVDDKSAIQLTTTFNTSNS